MTRAFAIAALFLLTGCTTVPVGGVSVCIGKCTITIKSGQPQTAAEKAGALAGGLFETIFKKNN